ncbi:MAG: glycosyltransferase, partial [Bacteroidota bacterium]
LRTSRLIKLSVLQVKSSAQSPGQTAMVYLTGQFSSLLYYWFISRILGFPIILNYVEYRLAFNNRGFFTRINDWLFDNYCARWCDGILPISEYLVEVVHKQTRKTPQLKVPVICDFEKFAVTPEEDKKPHFLYVGAASYLPLIEFVTEAFDGLDNPNGVELHLVLGGKPHQIEAAQAHINKMQNSHLVHLTPNAPHTTIPQRLANASGLLIPMRPTLQDEARFPHKVGEYLASSTPLITTAFGEIRYYFRDEETALIADDYDPAAFAEKMQYIVQNPVAAAQIGENGRRMGLQEFNYITFGQRMRDFIAQVMGEEVLAEPVKHPANV